MINNMNFYKKKKKTVNLEENTYALVELKK